MDDEVATNGKLSDVLSFDLYLASHALTAAYRPLLLQLGLTYPQYLVLTLLWENEGAPLKQLNDSLHLDYNTLSPLLRRMCAKGLVTRHRRLEDGRHIGVQLTADGMALRARALGVHDLMRTAIALDDDEVAGVRAALQSIMMSARSALNIEA